MNKNHKNVGRILNYNEPFVILISTVTRFVFISAFASLAGVWVGIVNSAMGLKICAITAGIKKYKSIVKKKEDHDKMVLLTKSKLNSLEV